MKSRSFLTSRGVSYTVREVEKSEGGTKVQPAASWMGDISPEHFILLAALISA